MQRQLSGVAQRERPQVFDEAIQRAGVVEQHRQMCVVARMDAVELGLDLALQHGERCAQLVGDVGEETPARLLRGLEPARHLVEGSPEGAHSSRAGGSHTGVIVPAAEALGAVEQVADRACQAAIGEERGNRARRRRLRRQREAHLVRREHRPPPSRRPRTARRTRSRSPRRRRRRVGIGAATSTRQAGRARHVADAGGSRAESAPDRRVTIGHGSASR